MSEVNHAIIQLILEYLSGEIEVSGKQELSDWINEKEENRLFFERITQEHMLKNRREQWEKIDTETAIQIFDRRTGGTIKQRQKKRWLAYTAVAAVVLLVIGISSYHLMYQPAEPLPVAATILPGSDKAILILANGEKMNLEERDSLQVSLGAGNHFMNSNKQLVYEGKASAELQYNELQIPKGGEYQVKLADGSVVRLNSGSSLKYPVAFGEDKREVELMGEAYFEIAKEAAPFYVKVRDLNIRVYGTTFNINSHLEDRIQTALVEGKVSILMNGKEFMLRPSQVADFDILSQTLDIRETDLAPYLAWTRGLFMFNNESLKQIMHTLSLWYDTEVFFQNPSLQELHFTGCVKRYESIDNILRALSQSVGVKINKQNKTLTVSY